MDVIEAAKVQRDIESLATSKGKLALLLSTKPNEVRFFLSVLTTNRRCVLECSF